MLEFSQQSVKAAEANEKDKSKTFSYFWTNNLLGDIKVEYERMLKNIPEERAMKWKDAVGLNNRVVE